MIFFFISIYFRYIGASNGYKYDSVTLFEYENFSGNTQAAFDDKYSLPYKYYGRYVFITFNKSAWMKIICKIIIEVCLKHHSEPIMLTTFGFFYDTFDHFAKSVNLTKSPTCYASNFKKDATYVIWMYWMIQYIQIKWINTSQFRSMAITGCKPWTVYTSTGYYGNCMCVYPKDTNNCEVGLYPNLGYFNTKIVSVRKGCYCSYSKHPSLP